MYIIHEHVFVILMYFETSCVSSESTCSQT